MDKRRDIMTPAEAVADIIAKVKTIRGDTEIDEAVLGIYVEKLVNDVLDYCHRHDFPRALTFTCMDLINKRIDDEQTAAEEDAQLKSIEAGDTKFEFNVAAAISSGVLNFILTAVQQLLEISLIMIRDAVNAVHVIKMENGLLFLPP